MLTKMTIENKGTLQQSNFNTDWFAKYGLDFILIPYM